MTLDTSYAFNIQIRKWIVTKVYKRQKENVLSCQNNESMAMLISPVITNGVNFMMFQITLEPNQDASILV